MKNYSDYFLGLDIGTDSVGWAVTDTTYHLQKANQKTLWGVRLFDTAETAEGRRMFRTARRRLERRKQRIQWLQQIFDEEICKLDPAFYLRLQESKFLMEDKDPRLSGKHNLFSGAGFTDKEYYKRYPTIYHLRFALLSDTKTAFDARLVYLAIHHILKYRGHFLFDGNIGEGGLPLADAMNSLFEYTNREYEYELGITDMAGFEKALKNRGLSITAKEKELRSYTTATKEDVMGTALVKLLAGGTVKLADLYDDAELKNGDLKSFSFKEDFDAKEAQLEAVLGERLDLIRHAKAIYDWAVLANILQGQKYLSAAKVDSYEKHQFDLKRLKNAVKDNFEDFPRRKGTDGKETLSVYSEIFRVCQKDKCNYAAYSGRTKENFRCSYEDFRKFLEKILAPKKDVPEIAAILAELQLGTFLPKQTTKDNSVIPNQVHRHELVQILTNASRYLSFLNEKDSDGITARDKILAIFDYRIPYYVGPLKNGWAVRTEDQSGAIYPWNFDQRIDLEKSAEGFITRMTSKCTYIGEPVLPKSSLLYSEFMVLNELNNLCINGKRISTPCKQGILSDLFAQCRKVTAKALRDYLLSTGVITKEDTISGVDGDFKSSLQSFIIFKQLLQRLSRDEVEDIILHLTLFGESKQLMSRWLQKTFGKRLSSEDVKYILRQKISGWGNLSREFLTRLYHVEPTGEAVTIIEMLRNNSVNLMELLSRKYGFRDDVERYRIEHNTMLVTSGRDYVEQSYASPAVKRAILQSIAITDELVKIMGKPPKRIFVEMARGEQEKKRTVSRKNALMELYKKCGEDANPLFAELEARDESSLRRDKLYLYYTQLGKCMYTGQPIDLARLDTDYDIDHIFPQSKVKDDGLSNRVLVYRPENEKKGDKYPIAAAIREKMRPFWTALKTKSLIDQKKFDRLTRSDGFSVDELSGFIARQLVETRQSSKIVADILGKRYGKASEIVYVKAGNVSDFRRKADDHGSAPRTYDFVKCREVNDLHHAKDAYLNIVVGNVYHVKFTADPRRYFFKEPENRNYSMNRVFDYPVQRNGETAWLPGPDGFMAHVRQTMRKNNILFTRLATEATGGLFDQTIMPAGKGQAVLKTSDPRMTVEKYGGYNKVSGSFFCLVEHDDKKKRIRSFEPVFLMHKELYERDPLGYCRSVLGLSNPEIVIAKIKINALFSLNGFRMHLSSRTGSQLRFKNANQLIVAPEQQAYIKRIGKYAERCRVARAELPLTGFDGVTAAENTVLYDILVQKLMTPLFQVKYKTPCATLTKNRDAFVALSVLDQCTTLLEILKMLSCTAAGADLKLLCQKSDIGILLTSKKLTNFEGDRLELIHPSVTGVFEKRIPICRE